MIRLIRLAVPRLATRTPAVPSLVPATVLAFALTAAAPLHATTYTPWSPTTPRECFGGTTSGSPVPPRSSLKARAPWNSTRPIRPGPP